MQPNSIQADLSSIRVKIIYDDTPAIIPEKPNRFKIIVENLRMSKLEGEFIMEPPKDFIILPTSSAKFSLDINDKKEFQFEISAKASNINMSNRGLAKIYIHNRPSVLSVPLIFVGSFRWLYSDVYYEENLTLNDEFSPEKDVNSLNRGSKWYEISWPDYELKVEELFRGKPGILYLKHFIYSPNEIEVRIGVPSNSKMRLWLNGKLIHETLKTVPLRPNYGGDGSNYTDAKLSSGWNTIMIKLLREKEPIKAYFMISDSEWHSGLVNVVRSKFPWETGSE